MSSLPRCRVQPGVHYKIKLKPRVECFNRFVGDRTQTTWTRGEGLEWPKKSARFVDGFLSHYEGVKWSFAYLFEELHFTIYLFFRFCFPYWPVILFLTVRTAG